MSDGPAPTLVVLAAGMGSRYGGLKQIDPFGPGGETLLDYSIFDAHRAGFGKILFVIRRDIEQAFVDSVGSKYDGLGLELDYAYQELDSLPPGFSVPADRTKPWGTGHATLMARRSVAGPFAVLNADDFYGARSFASVARFLTDEKEPAPPPDRYAMAGFLLRDTLSDHGPVVRGVCETRDGYLQRIDERREVAEDGDGVSYQDDSGRRQPLTGDETVSMNFWGCVPSIFDHLEEQFIAFLERSIDDEGAEFLLPDVVDGLISRGLATVRVLPCDGPWFGVTYREDSEAVARKIRDLIGAGEYPELLWVAP